MLSKYFVSAYASSPSFHKWNMVDETKYFQKLARNPKIVGIEHPFLVQSENYPISWLKDNIPAHWSMIITSLPGCMQKAKKNINFGIASANEKDRCLAVALIQDLNRYVHKINDIFGRQLVKAVHLHSLPTNDNSAFRSNKLAFKRSLNEIKNMDWTNIELNIEHCDSYIPGRTPEKGFMRLQDEIETIAEIGEYGMVLNWARSAIEYRSINGPLEHILTAQKNNLLKGFFFSSCTNNEKSKYGDWKDTHMPPKNFIKDTSYLAEDSLLGYEEIKNVLLLLDNKVYFGIKVLNPDSEVSVSKSIGLNFETIAAVENVVDSLKETV